MTCHHRAAQRNPVTREPWPRYAKGEQRRCRCQVIDQPEDHCHQPADQEDMICTPCRRICWEEAPERFEIKVVDEAPWCNGRCPEAVHGHGHQEEEVQLQ
jgi:hypothetical protein